MKMLQKNVMFGFKNKILILYQLYLKNLLKMNYFLTLESLKKKLLF